jgi:hypothetical protein
MSMSWRAVHFKAMRVLTVDALAPMPAARIAATSATAATPTCGNGSAFTRVVNHVLGGAVYPPRYVSPWTMWS